MRSEHGPLGAGVDPFGATVSASSACGAGPRPVQRSWPERALGAEMRLPLLRLRSAIGSGRAGESHVRSATLVRGLVVGSFDSRPALNPAVRAYSPRIRSAVETAKRTSA